MEEIVTILSTGEWAIAIWGTGFFVWMLTQSEIRKSLWNVIKILLGKKLRHFFLIIALYVAGITMIFYQLPFWNNIYLKDIACLENRSGDTVRYSVHITRLVCFATFQVCENGSSFFHRSTI